MVDVTAFMNYINTYWASYVASCGAGACNQMFLDFVNIMWGFVQMLCTFGCYVK